MGEIIGMLFFILLFIIVLIILLKPGPIFKNFNNKTTENISTQSNNIYQPQITIKENIYTTSKYLPYAKGKLLTKTEQAFFRNLIREALKRRLLVCPKVRLEDIIYVTDYRNKLKYRGYIKSRHVDFVLINTSGETVAAIELDDPSHNTAKAAEIDQFKNELFSKVGIPLIRIKTGVNYIEHLNKAFDYLHFPKSELQKTQP